MSRFRQGAGEHLRQYAGFYVFLIVLFGTGVAFGALAVGALDATQRLELQQYLDFFLRQFEESDRDLSPHTAARDALISNLRTAGLIVLLGFTIVGALLVPVIVFFRGFLIGFSVGFLLVSHGWWGLVLSLVGILPQNLLAVPTILVLSVSSLGLGFRFLRRSSLFPPVWKRFMAHALTGSLGILVLSAAGLVEGYIAPLLLHYLIRWFTPL